MCDAARTLGGCAIKSIAGAVPKDAEGEPRPRRRNSPRGREPPRVLDERQHREPGRSGSLYRTNWRKVVFCRALRSPARAHRLSGAAHRPAADTCGASDREALPHNPRRPCSLGNLALGKNAGDNLSCDPCFAIKVEMVLGGMVFRCWRRFARMHKGGSGSLRFHGPAVFRAKC